MLGPVRVLFSSTTGVGHVFPMLPLARAFVAAGHDVLWAAGEQVHDVLTGAGIPAVACGPTGDEDARLRASVRGPAMDVAPPDRAAFVFPRMFGAALAPPMAADLLPAARAWRPDLLVHENGELASPLVGAVLGVPSLTHAFGGPVPAPHLSEAGERLSSMWSEQGLEVPPYAGCFETTYLDICPASVRSEPRDHVVDVQPLRPVADIGGSPEPAPLADEQDGPPLLYVTMGTVQNRALDLGPLVAALAALPVRVLVATGRDADPDALGAQPANVVVERWVDQPRVVRQSSAVVSHGGSGTFLGALAAGVPQLCLPQAADQFRNAEGGLLSGAALRLLPPEISPSTVAEAAHRLLTDPAFRDAATGVAAEIAAMPSPDEVAVLLAGRFGGPGRRTPWSS
jgi:UDP:flavonoid glycosyltransferase YjiC (YdhE family)